MGDSRGFTGRRRERRTRRSVRLADTVSRLLITVGGIGTIISVATVCLFLTVVVLPLFLGAESELALEEDSGVGSGATVRLSVDEYNTIGYEVTDAGVLRSFRLDTGETLDEQPMFAGRRPTAWSFGIGPGVGVAGFDDGTIEAFVLRFQPRFVEPSDVPDSYFEMEAGETRPLEDGIVERTPEGQFRLQRLTLEKLGRPHQIKGASSIVDLDHAGGRDNLRVLALVRLEDGGAGLRHVGSRETENFMTGEREFKFAGEAALPYSPRSGEDAKFVRLSGIGTLAYAIWPDGATVRLRTSPPSEAYVAETVDVAETPGETVTAAEFMLGGTTLLIGTSGGEITGWFPVALEGEAADAAESEDGFEFIRAKVLAKSGEGDRGGVRDLDSSTRSRMAIAGFDDGTVAVYHTTSASELLTERTNDGKPASAVAMSPKEDGILAVAGNRLSYWKFDPGHPEATFTTLFTPVRYEGYADREFMWQSSAATDAFEPKLSLIPLVFGTIKATFYSMLFGAPLALLAALYTSEFLDPKAKSVVKPTIELMASLPSVVLGFLAALVFAPFIERFVPAVLGAVLAMPFVFLLGSYLWQILPKAFILRMQKHRPWFIAPFLFLGVGLAMLIGPTLESWLFGGEIKAWLNGLNAEPKFGDALGGWVVLLTPLMGVLVAFVMAARVSPWLRGRTGRLSRRGLALVDLLKFLGGALVTLGLVLGVGQLLTSMGFDIRAPLPFFGSFMETYDQRNCLVVGVIMGFAIIPIIYTISEDALSTVPDHLRSASLGAGATPWQTAVRIIIPTAMSGLFSAMMIGLGRAVGETMIVLMALGNTPVMDMNIFEGARTLSANIAVELPEAPQGETHYRILFLAALTLFAMTFVLNTVAEVVRLRFRKRAYQL